ncbi:MAG: acyl-CoA dehydrogenase, partial [Candidatus Omnitrophota bacterium]
SRIAAELVFGYNPHPAWDGKTCDSAHSMKAGPCAVTTNLEEFVRLRAKLDGCLTGCRIAKDRAATALTQVMIPEALDYPL